LFVVSGAGVMTFGAHDLGKLGEWSDRGLATITFDITPDGRRALSVYQQNLDTDDNEKGGLIDKHVTGSSMSRLAAALGASAATENSKAQGIRAAREKGKSHYSYTDYTVRDPDQSLAITPDSKVVYVINRQTSDVTLADTETGKIIEKVGADGYAVDFMSKAGVALVTNTTAVHAIDLTTHEVVQNWSSKEYSFDRPEISADGKSAVVKGNTAVLLISGGSGKPVGKLSPFKRVADLEVDWGRGGERPVVHSAIGNRPSGWCSRSVSDRRSPPRAPGQTRAPLAPSQRRRRSPRPDTSSSCSRRRVAEARARRWSARSRQGSPRTSSSLPDLLTDSQ